MVENGNGNHNGSGSNSADVARLSERSFAHASQLTAHEDRIAALEELLAERTRGADRRDIAQWVGVALSLVGVIAVLWGFGIGPVKDSIGVEIAERKNDVSEAVKEVKGDLRAKGENVDAMFADREKDRERGEQAIRDIMDERDLRYEQRMDNLEKQIRDGLETRLSDIKYLNKDHNDKIDNVERRLERIESERHGQP